MGIGFSSESEYHNIYERLNEKSQGLDEKSQGLDFTLYDIRTGGDCLFEALLSFLYLHKIPVDSSLQSNLTDNPNLNLIYSVFQRYNCDGVFHGTKSLINKDIMKNSYQDCEAIKQLKKIRENLSNVELINKKIDELKKKDNIIGEYIIYNNGTPILNLLIDESNTDVIFSINSNLKNYYDNKGGIVWGAESDAYIFAILYKFNVNIYQFRNKEISDKVSKERAKFNTDTYDKIDNFNKLPNLRNTVTMQINISNLILFQQLKLKENYPTINLLIHDKHWMILYPNHQHHISGGIHHIFNFGLIGLLIICIIWLIIIIYKQLLYNKRRYNLRILYKKYAA
jgi:hypothetical protein